MLRLKFEVIQGIVGTTVMVLLNNGWMSVLRSVPDQGQCWLSTSSVGDVRY